MTVIEARGRGGQLLVRTHCPNLVITVGRAFDNDVILEDPYVSPHHLRLTKTHEGWRVDDLDSLNGVRRNVSGGDTESLRSGDDLRIGHTVLHLYDASHPVSATLELGDAEAQFSMLGRNTVWPVLVALSALVSVVTGYWGSVEEFKPLAMVQSVFEGVLAVLFIAAFWALLGRLLRHRAYFLAHLSIWLILGGLLKAVNSVAQWFGYNANSIAVEESLGMLLELCVGAYALWGSLVLSTNLHGRMRIASALGAALGLLSVNLATELQFDRDFSPRPKYYARLAGPGLLWARPAGEGILLDALGPLFDEADAKIAEDEEAASEDREVGDLAADQVDGVDEDELGADAGGLAP